MEPYKKVEQALHKHISQEIFCSLENGAIKLEGMLEDWQDVVKAGQMAAKTPYRGVINRIQTPRNKATDFSKPSEKNQSLDGRKPDVLIIGGGIIGSAMARALTRYQLDILLIEKEYDVAIHTSSRNDGMVHPGFAPKLGSLKSRYNVRGNAMYSKVAQELGVPVMRNGSYILFDKNYLKPAKYYMLNKAEKAGIPGATYMDRKTLLGHIPNVNDAIQWALHLPSAGVTSPYKMTVAYAENAVMNGAEIALNTAALSIEKEGGQILSVTTNKGRIYPKVVINAAGTFADIIADMAGDQFYTIHPRKGEIALLDRKTGKYLNAILGKPTISLHKQKSKGGGLIRTPEGNLLIGPNNYEVEEREDYSTNRGTLEAMLSKQLPLIPALKRSDVITYFAGTRASTYKEDFIIETSNKLGNLVHIAGIQSPGFASAPAIAEEGSRLCLEALGTQMAVKKNPNFNPRRKPPLDLTAMPLEARAKVIKENPDYGKIVCRCEEISKGEIIEALRSPLPVQSVDGVKRRTRAGMGRCQGGFCMPHVMEIIREEKGIDLDQVTKKDLASPLLVGATKEAKSHV